jgi:probable HAF family extracellular repeat protein
MKSRTLTCVIAITLFAALALPGQVAAQHTRYKLVDIPTLGGPNSYTTPAGPGVLMLNNAGAVAGWADTTTPDPTCLSNPFTSAPDGSCLLTHAFRWENGSLTDLGALPGANSSAAVAINAGGWIVGASNNGLPDPVSGLQQIRAVLWKGNQLTNLGTVGGKIVLPQTLNNVGQVVGGFENTTPDPFSLFGFPTQTRAFFWHKGMMQDIGTLGGPDAFAFSINERGQVAGMSYTDATPNATTGKPTLEPFLWQDGKMISLGTLGGTMGGTGPQGSIMINNRGQIIGTSNLAGDQFFHAFLWENGVMSDLRTLGGPTSTALWINEPGEVVGEADISNVQDSTGAYPHHAFLWRDGMMTDLGTLGSTSHAEAINARGQVVGRSRLGSEISVLQHAFLWEDGGPMIDLNSVVTLPPGLQLIDAVNINERGEILVVELPPGVQPGQGMRLALLVPCAGDEEACNDNAEAGTAATQKDVLITNPATSGQSRPTINGMARWRERLARRYHIPVGAPRD